MTHVLGAEVLPGDGRGDDERWPAPSRLASRSHGAAALRGFRGSHLVGMARGQPGRPRCGDLGGAIRDAGRGLHGRPTEQTPARVASEREGALVRQLPRAQLRERTPEVISAAERVALTRQADVLRFLLSNPVGETDGT